VSYPAPVWGGKRTTAAAPEKEKIILPPLPIAVPETEKMVPPPTAAYKPIQDTDVITVLPLDLLDPYPNNPFKPYRSEQLEELAESILEMGIMNPILVRRKDGGRYEILAGQNRTAAARLLEHTAIPCIIREADDDTAAIIVTENNLRHREFLLPSEKGFAFKMQLESMKRQAGRPRKNVSQCETHIAGMRSDQELAEKSGDSRATIQRYIRLTYLIPDFLDMVDEGSLAFTPAVEISYLGQPEQKTVLKYFFHDKKGLLDIKTAKLLRERSSMVELTTLEIMLLMNKNRRVVACPKFTKRDFKKLNQYIPQGTPKTEMMEILLNALKQYYA
jgi:ParB family chromosome partitioning protein